jgi:hypothetical protein
MKDKLEFIFTEYVSPDMKSIVRETEKAVKVLTFVNCSVIVAYGARRRFWNSKRVDTRTTCSQ